MPQTDSKPAPVQEGSVQLRHEEVMYSGPVPPPEVIQRMERILPGAADRIFTMAEKDQDAQIYRVHQVEDRATLIETNDHTEKMTALVMAFVCCLVFICGGIYLIANGHTWPGGIILGTSAVAIVGAFLGQKRKPQNK